MAAASSAEWETMVDEVANGEEEDLQSVLANYNPVIPSAVLQHSRERFAERDYVPTMSAEDALHAKPAKAHQTDVFLTSDRNAEPSFLEMVDSIARTDAVSEQAEAPNFDPIILVSDMPTAVVQKCNVQQFLQHGEYRSYEALHQLGDELATSLVAAREAEIYVEPRVYGGLSTTRVTFRRFRVINDPRQVKDWNHVCACFVTGQQWQFDEWFGKGSKESTDPGHLFAKVRGYFGYYEESKLPAVIKQWRVVPLLLPRKDLKMHAAVRVAANFWEDLYEFMDSHPYFRRFSLWPVGAPAADGRVEGLPTQA